MIATYNWHTELNWPAFLKISCELNMNEKIEYALVITHASLSLLPEVRYVMVVSQQCEEYVDLKTG